MKKLIKYEYLDCGEEGKCLFKDNVEGTSFIIELPYPFDHNFWHLDHDDETVLKKSRKIRDSLSQT